MTVWKIQKVLQFEQRRSGGDSGGDSGGTTGGTEKGRKRCNDGLDNDGDALIDGADSDCR